MTFKEIFKGPFTLDDFKAYVWSDNGVMTFTCLTYNDVLLEALIEKLNYGSSDHYNVSYEKGIIYVDNVGVFLMRGWGHLTGSLNLPSEKAAKIQDDFCNWVVKTLS